MRSSRLALFIASALIVTLVGGCSLLFGEERPGNPPETDEMRATFVGGRNATITVGPDATADPSTFPTMALEPTASAEPTGTEIDPTTDGVKIATFLGNEQRNFYGLGPVPAKLELIWKFRIGSGKTGGKGGGMTWSGAGWTGQVTVVRDKGKDYLLIGGYDHGLHKLDAATGEEVWRYGFDDVIKGSNTVFENKDAKSDEDRYIVVGGSRRGFPLSLGSPNIAPVRAISFKSGKELWRLPVPRTGCYSQDADSSGLYLFGKYYEFVESGYGYILDPNRTTAWNGHRKPVIEHQTERLYTSADASKHGGNLVTEASPMLLGDRIYVSSGSGHIYGFDKDTLKTTWDFFTGSDLDGSTVANSQGMILAAIEKQYIAQGGIYMLDPTKPPSKAVKWFFPSENHNLAEWEGGVIGSTAINDSYNRDGSKPSLAAFNAIDGNMYVISQDKIVGTTKDHTGKKQVPTPALVFKSYIGGAISTPIIVDDYVIAAGYDAKVHLYKISYQPPGSGAKGVELTSRSGETWITSVKEVDTFSGGGSFEATPIVWGGRVYIASRDGNLYALGLK